MRQYWCYTQAIPLLITFAEPVEAYHWATKNGGFQELGRASGLRHGVSKHKLNSLMRPY